jgi:uncharacterized membrane protein YphA (DoxX/SURF4 family)
MEYTYLQSSSLLLLRLILGVLFLFQGYDKIFRIGIASVADATTTPETQRIMSKSFFRGLIFLSSWIELLAGIMLIIGYQRDFWLVMLGADMLGTALIFSIIKPMWDMRYYLPRLLLLLVLMLAPEAWDVFRIDSLLK